MRNRALTAVAAGAAALVVLGAPAAHAEGRGDIRVIKTVVHGGTDVSVGTKGTVVFPIVMTIRDNSGVKSVSHVSAFNRSNLFGPVSWTGTRCTKKSATTSVCTATMAIHPEGIRPYGEGGFEGWNANQVAGLWQVNATVRANDGDYWISDDIARFKVRRGAVLTTDAGPEPVAKRGTLTVKGQLKRADWQDLKYHTFAGQPVRLQFKKAGSTQWSTVKTATTNSSGGVSVKMTATAAGSWRWVFSGTSTTGQATSAADAVVLK
ncbi:MULTISPECIES: hypothetical protein [unclassified Streptomyces]|uniref:hypothetical protein n=1 Tax=unclassified Streptomyces TaxID=2593676 RepID=UPI00380D4877